MLKLFIIHRSKDRKQARALLKKSEQKMSASFNLIFLNSPSSNSWKDHAISAMTDAEAIIIYNRQSCEESKNAKWEINKAIKGNLKIIDINPGDTQNDVCFKLKSLYDFEDSFHKCFNSKNGTSILDLYKLMVDSSESLIERRQKTNAFFITVIGSLLTIAGLLVKCGALITDTIWLIHSFAIVGLLLCNSWRNIIDNYGKLNKAKFDVILRLEKELDAQIFEAEWISLGKGLRPKKYKSFTSTEKNVPLYFALLILGLSVFLIIKQIIGFK